MKFKKQQKDKSNPLTDIEYRKWLYQEYIMISAVMDIWRNNDVLKNKSYYQTLMIEKCADFVSGSFNMEQLMNRDKYGNFNFSPKKMDNISVLLSLKEQKKLIKEAFNDLKRYMNISISGAPFDSSPSKEKIDNLSPDSLIILNIKNSNDESYVKKTIDKLEQLKRKKMNVVLVMEDIDSAIKEIKEYMDGHKYSHPFNMMPFSQLMEDKRKLYYDVISHSKFTKIFPIKWEGKNKANLEKLLHLTPLENLKDPLSKDNLFFPCKGTTEYALFKDVENNKFINKYHNNKSRSYYLSNEDTYHFDVENHLKVLKNKLGTTSVRDFVNHKNNIENDIKKYLPQLLDGENNKNVLDKISSYKSSINRFWKGKNYNLTDYFTFHTCNNEFEKILMEKLNNSNDDKRLDIFKNFVLNSNLLNEKKYTQIVWDISSKYPDTNFGTVLGKENTIKSKNDSSYKVDSLTYSLTKDALLGETFESKERELWEKQEKEYFDNMFLDEDRVSIKLSVKKIQDKIKDLRDETFHKKSPLKYK